MQNGQRFFSPLAISLGLIGAMMIGSYLTPTPESAELLMLRELQATNEVEDEFRSYTANFNKNYATLEELQ